MEHGHIITLTHIEDELRSVAYFVCACGEKSIGPLRVIKSLMLAHRMEVFPSLRSRL